MFPLPLRDIMHLSVDYGRKIALRRLPPFFRPFPRRSGKRSRDCAGSFSLAMFSLSLAPRCRRRRDARADADRYLGQLRFVSYITQSVSQRYPLRGFHVEIPFNPFRPRPHRSPPLSLLSPSRDDACLIVFVLLPRATRV